MMFIMIVNTTYITKQTDVMSIDKGSCNIYIYIHIRSHMNKGTSLKYEGLDVNSLCQHIME